MRSTPTLASLAADLATGRCSARRLVEGCLQRADDGESCVYTLVMRRQALASADAVDAMRAAGVALGPLAGVPVSVKVGLEGADFFGGGLTPTTQDLFDVEG